MYMLSFLWIGGLLLLCYELHSVFLGKRAAPTGAGPAVGFYINPRLSVWDELACRVGTDKCTSHHYGLLYTKYLENPPNRLNKLKVGGWVPGWLRCYAR